MPFYVPPELSRDPDIRAEAIRRRNDHQRLAVEATERFNAEQRRQRHQQAQRFVDKHARNGWIVVDSIEPRGRVGPLGLGAGQIHGGLYVYEHEGDLYERWGPASLDAYHQPSPQRVLVWGGDGDTPPRMYQRIGGAIELAARTWLEERGRAPLSAATGKRKRRR